MDAFIDKISSSGVKAGLAVGVVPSVDLIETKEHSKASLMTMTAIAVDGGSTRGTENCEDTAIRFERKFKAAVQHLVRHEQDLKIQSVQKFVGL
jgi:hypothetical protein